MGNLSRRGFIGALSGAAAATAFAGEEARAQDTSTSSTAGNRGKIKITDVKCAIIGRHPVVRIVTDAGISGYGETEPKRNVKPMIAFYKDYLVGEDPTDVNRILLKIRRIGAFKPWGAAVSAIEIALWDVAGKAAGLPVYKLLGGRIHDQVRPYGNSENNSKMTPITPQDYAELASEVKAAKEGYTLIKLPVSFHNFAMLKALPDAWYGERWTGYAPPYQDRGMLTQPGIDQVIACVEAAKKAVGDDIGLAFDCGPGWTVKDAIRFARAVEPLDLAWLEDLITGDYEPYPNAQEFKEVTDSTSTRIHTGEEIYLRENFKDLIEMQAVNVLGPDPEDVGGISELKWIAEYANLHGMQVAPHGIFDGLFGTAAQLHLGAVCPQNYIAFEYSKADTDWWPEIVEGLPDPIVKNGFMNVDDWERPGLGITFNVKAAQAHLKDEDKDFFA